MKVYSTKTKVRKRITIDDKLKKLYMDLYGNKQEAINQMRMLQLRLELKSLKLN